ncbi:MAG TPA: hypothetical protein VKB19_16125 [Pedobacter sp.]|nr:hypothetical protein [Pedobacter sp.]
MKNQGRKGCIIEPQLVFEIENSQLANAQDPTTSLGGKTFTRWLPSAELAAPDYGSADYPQGRGR